MTSDDLFSVVDAKGGGEPSSAPVPAAAPDRPAGRGTPVLNQAFDIFFEQPQSRYQHAGARAYSAWSSRGMSCLALVCERSSIPRVQRAERYAGIASPFAARLVGQGVVPCPDGVERYAFFYENNFGDPLVPGQGETSAYGMRSDLVLNAVLKPAALMLQDMHNADLAHGAIRLANLFDGGLKPLQKIVVGDCLSQVYLSGQPLLYLSPSKAMAQPSGRGENDRTDDVYALGVVCALLLRTKDPFANKSEQDVLLSKIEMGTFSTLLESERLQPNVLEMLRGVLNDDPHQRWSITDLLDWFEGRRANVRQGSKRMKASRPLDFGVHKIFMPQVLAYYMPQDLSFSTQLVESGELKQWITRSLSDARLDERFETALQTSIEQGRGPGFPERMVCRMVSAFEDSFPIVYKTVRSFPDSIGAVLAELYMNGGDTRPIADIIRQQAVSFWLNMQLTPPADINLVVGRFDQCNTFLKQTTIGYGLERCVYFLAPDAPCLSDKFHAFYVRSPEDLLVALNAISDSNTRPQHVLDRHMISFLSVRDRKVIDTALPDLNSSEPYRQASGTIRTLAEIQARSRMGAMVPLTRWLAELVEPLFARFHDRDLRQALKKRLSDLRESGSIRQFVDSFLNPELVRRDQYDFRVAMREYYHLRVEDYHLTRELEKAESYGTQAGREIAALLAGLVMSLVVIGFLVLHFNQGAVPW